MRLQPVNARFWLPECSDALQKNAALGRDLSSTPLHVCQCPNCFTSFATANGIECVPKCDLATCDEDTGVCNAEGASGIASAQPAPRASTGFLAPSYLPTQCFPLVPVHLSVFQVYSSSIHGTHCVLLQQLSCASITMLLWHALQLMQGWRWDYYQYEGLLQHAGLAPECLGISHCKTHCM